MSRSFSMAGHCPRFENKIKDLGLKNVGQRDFKEYFYCDGYAFQVFKDKNGNEYEEFEVACPWASGPVLYLGLKRTKDGKVICTWTNKEINEDMGIEVFDDSSD